MHKQGFTLVELLIVVAIIALLSTMAVHYYSGAITRTKVARALGELSRFQSMSKRPATDPWGSPYGRLKDGKVYSFGPDRVDNGRQILYDPSNGTTSAGDVYLE